MIKFKTNMEVSQHHAIKLFVPRGGIGALLFWLTITFSLGALAAHFYLKSLILEVPSRISKDQEENLQRENERLRYQMERVQNELALTGNILKTQEEILEAQKEYQEIYQGEEWLRDYAKRSITLSKEALEWEVDLKKALNDYIERSDVKIIKGNGRLMIRIYNAALFNPGELKVNKEGTKLLQGISTILREHIIDYGMTVVGHADSTPVSASLAWKCPTNWELAASRANSVLHFFSKTEKIPEELISILSYGSARPIAGNMRRYDRAKNRRIELIIEATKRTR